MAEKKYPQIHTRFPPEPNGYLHIGHAKSICLNFGIAREFGGICNLRMDDTNPTKEDVEYVDSITEDVKWLISGWADDRLGLKPKGKTPETQTVNGKPDFYLAPELSTLSSQPSAALEPFYASDYFDQIYEYALQLIRKGVAYVDDLSPEDTDKYRGSPDRPGKESPFRNRSIEENLDLFTRMKNGEFPDGTRTLRAKIDMASPNIWMRDPVLYRIRHAEHHHTGGKWCIYPMYDFAHCLSDYIEGITHSICTLEFEVHRPLYDWILEQLDLPRPLPHQYEFARLSLGYTVMSKRKLMQLVNENLVSGWDDPRMPTISGLRRRGVTPQALRDFAYNIGITKYNGITDVAVLEYCHPRGPQPARPAPAGGAAAAQGRHHQLPRRPGRGTRSRQQSRRPERRQAQDSLQPRAVTSSATISWKRRRRSTSGCAPAAKCGSSTPTSSSATRSSRTPPARSSNCAAPPTWAARPAARPPAARSKAPSTGSAPRTPSTPRCASTTGCSPWPSPMPAAISSSI